MDELFVICDVHDVQEKEVRGYTLARIAALSIVRVRLRSARPFSDANKSVSDRNRSSSGRENHSDDTRPTRVPRFTSTL